MNLSEIVGFICLSEKENLISLFIFFPLINGWKNTRGVRDSG
jgi:hypothetical protein